MEEYKAWDFVIQQNIWQYDGTVVMEVQGRETLIFELMKGLNRNQFIQIDWIDTEEMEPELESSFEVKY